MRADHSLERHESVAGILAVEEVKIKTGGDLEVVGMDEETGLAQEPPWLPADTLPDHRRHDVVWSGMRDLDNGR